jgi:hypothetical protein
MDTFGSRIPWPVILLALVFFFPIGIVLLIMRILGDRGAALVMGSILAFVGWGGFFLFGLLGGIGFAQAQSQRGPIACGISVFLLGFALLGVLGSKLKARGSRVRRFVQLVINQGQTSIASMTQILGRADMPGVARELQQVIDSGYLPGVGIDYQTYTVQRSGMRPDGFQPPPLPGVVPGRAPAGGQVTFTCRACGANNAVSVTPGVAPRCEYCDSPMRT